MSNRAALPGHHKALPHTRYQANEKPLDGKNETSDTEGPVSLVLLFIYTAQRVDLSISSLFQNVFQHRIIAIRYEFRAGFVVMHVIR